MENLKQYKTSYGTGYRIGYRIATDFKKDFAEYALDVEEGYRDGLADGLESGFVGYPVFYESAPDPPVMPELDIMALQAYVMVGKPGLN